ncbi:beta 1-4 rhamnosyltransferase Cps2T [Enterococcus wangshanyuanii]|uniref:Glycosyl transferase n=1 Tax=Enterococcus wangshanyuanii TaxID=2005703 RepID=A0ABQ1PQF3_9ENTE|nr:glycosyltransferase family 1 protein [Enterococcus wangshanyuanii]GGD01219.1 glycosyl transferase [Enterococcus wangshanyuanii]
MKKKIQHVYIIGSKGIPAKYGGFETFVEKLTEYKQSGSLQYHVACMNIGDNLYGDGQKHFEYNQADCFNIDVPNIGPARAIYYDVKALDYAIELAKKNNDIEPIFYILACRIGPFLNHYKKKIKKINGKLYVNPDGHEWLRAKWSYPVRKYWKFSEKLMVKHADLMICDSLNIEKYIKSDYKQYTPKTTYIAYGTEQSKSTLSATDARVKDWFKEKNIGTEGYYLVVGRFVPENNYETMIKEFMKSDTKKDFVLVTNIEENKFYNKLKKETGFDEDPRIKFVGTVYDQELLKYIRENAFAYLHGHEVGGTNPSLLEALASTKVNLLLDVSFNKEVAGNSALYWNKEQLSFLIDKVDKLSLDDQIMLDKKADRNIFVKFSWDFIIKEYEALFMENNL